MKAIMNCVRWLCIPFLLVACRFGAVVTVEPIHVVFQSPANNAVVPVGRPVQITLAANAPDRVTRIELSVNGTLVAVSNNPGNTATYQAVIHYTPMNAGPLNLIARAFDKDETASIPAGLALQAVIEGATRMATPSQGTPVPENSPTPQSTPSTVPGLPGPGGCVLNAQFIADVTVPDGTVIPLGKSFTKTWRVRNSGTCVWDGSYKLVFASGSQLGAPGSVPLPTANAGDVSDISVPMQAPTSGIGTLTGEWRLVAPGNILFGNKLTVVIALPVPTASPEPTATDKPTALPPTAPVSPSVSFDADPASVTTGSCARLYWSTSNVAGVFLDGAGVPSPSEKSVCPTQTTTYTLKVDFNNGTSTIKLVVITVTAGAVLYNFADNAAAATWTNELLEALPFGGPDTDNRGFAMNRDGAPLEDNSLQYKVVETHPRWVPGGSIIGEYEPNTTLQSGDQFRTRIGFLKGAISGTVQLRVWFKDSIIGEISKSYTGALRDWVIDLTAFAGQSGRFRLQVSGNPSTTLAWVCWINPRIER